MSVEGKGRRQLSSPHLIDTKKHEGRVLSLLGKCRMIEPFRKVSPLPTGFDDLWSIHMIETLESMLTRFPTSNPESRRPQGRDAKKLRVLGPSKNK